MPNHDIRPGETANDVLSRLIDEELERHGFSAPKPTQPADSLEKILTDYPELFGKSKAGS